MNQTFSRKLTLYSFLMTIGIVHFHNVGYHNIEVYSRDIIEENVFRMFNNFSDSLSYLSLGYFFMVSAFLLYYDVTENNIYEKMKRRMYTLVIPFILWNIIAILYRTILDQAFPFHSFVELIEKFTINPQDGPLWYIFVLLIFMVAAPFIVKNRNNTPLLIALFCISLILSICISGFNIFSNFIDAKYFWFIWEIASYLPIYLLGAIAGLHYPDIIIEEKYNKRILSPIVGILYILSLIYICQKNLHGIDSWIILRIQPILVWFILDSRILKKDIAKPFTISFFIYAIHQPILLPILDKLYYGYLIRYTWSSYQVILFRMIGTIVVYFVTLVFTYVCKYILPSKLYSALSGGRVA